MAFFLLYLPNGTLSTSNGQETRDHFDGVLSLERGLWDMSGLQTRLSEEVILREIQEKTKVEYRKGESG